MQQSEPKNQQLILRISHYFDYEADSRGDVYTPTERHTAD